jgi:hypothetical protein
MAEITRKGDGRNYADLRGRLHKRIVKEQLIEALPLEGAADILSREAISNREFGPRELGDQVTAQQIVCGYDNSVVTPISRGPSADELGEIET